MKEKMKKTSFFTIGDFFKLIGSIIILAAIIAFAVFIIVKECSGFSTSKVDKINIGDEKAQVEKVLGEPYEKDNYTYEYYSSNYVNLIKKIEKELGDAIGMNADNDISVVSDDVDKDLDEALGDLDKQLQKLEKYEKQLKELKFDYVRVNFDESGKVISVFFQKKKCLSDTEVKKDIKEDSLITTSVKANTPTNIAYKVAYTDGSLSKFVAKYEFVGVKEEGKETATCKINFKDSFGNTIDKNVDITVTE